MWFIVRIGSRLSRVVALCIGGFFIAFFQYCRKFRQVVLPAFRAVDKRDIEKSDVIKSEKSDAKNRSKYGEKSLCQVYFKQLG